MSINILAINSSIFSESGVSSQLTQSALHHLHAAWPEARVKVRDLGRDEIPHFAAGTIAAIGEQRAELADELIEELQKADILLLGVPMYNFSVPSQFKAWMDHVARAGTTFKYTDKGPVGLLSEKKVLVLTSRGGLHQGQASETITPLLRSYLSLLGLNDVHFVYAEGLNMGGELRQQNIANAELRITEIINEYVDNIVLNETQEVAI